MFLFCFKEKNNSSLSIFCQKLPFLPQNAWFFFLKSKNGVLEIFLKSNILCTKILGTVKFFLKLKNFLKSNVLKSKIHCTANGCQTFEFKRQNIAGWCKRLSVNKDYSYLLMWQNLNFKFLRNLFWWLVVFTRFFPVVNVGQFLLSISVFSEWTQNNHISLH